MNILKLINELLDYGLEKDFITKNDYIYIANRLIELFKLDTFETIKTKPRNLNLILDDIANYAYSNKIIDCNDIVTIDNFKAKVMDEILPRPSEVISKFNELYKESPKKATDYFYKSSKDSNYIQTKRIAQNESWESETSFGKLQLTINLSKPEKDPKVIAMQKNYSSTYPKCQLCAENEGYRGHIKYDSRANMRIIPLNLNNENWKFQYSPYSYFNEHSIVLNENHVPMVVNKDSFRKLIEFLDYFPHYFVGSNAGLPIVGGSILSHEHFQSGRHKFPIEDAKEVFIGTYKSVSVSRLIWPMSTIRITSNNKEDIITLASKILDNWQNYQNEELSIINRTNDFHNTITPIARIKDNNYVFDLILRNNYTNSEYPDGVFHIYPKYYHIKKENIGLIEAMGMGVLPPRLKNEFSIIEEILKGKHELLNDKSIEAHRDWVKELIIKYYGNVEPMEFIKQETAIIFSEILDCASVFKMNKKELKYFDDFIKDSIK